MFDEREDVDDPEDVEEPGGGESAGLDEYGQPVPLTRHRYDINVQGVH